MQQRTEAWYEARKGLVTGSNVGAILGYSPYRSADDVMRAMVREHHGAESEFTGNVATEYGTFHEAGAIQDYQMESGNNVEPAGFVVHPQHSWLGASPDGYIDHDGLIEVKCPYGQREKNPPVFKPAAEQYHYYAQMQIQMACTGRRWCDFYQWAPHGTSIERIGIDRQFITAAISALEYFYRRYLKELDNPEHLEPKRREINTALVAKLVAEYDDLAEAIDTASARKKEVLAELVDLANEQNAIVAGRNLTQVERKGSVAYAKVVKEHCPGVDLKPYTGKPTSYWMLK